MKRAWILAAALAAACGGTEKSQVSVFAASPDTIQLGGTTALVFGASNAQTLTIDQGIGDVTGKDHVFVSPATTTTYTITAQSKDRWTDTKTVTVTVVAARASSYTVDAPASATAGAQVALTITARGPDGAALDTFVGTATLATDDASATLPHLATFAAGGHGKATVNATFKTAGQHQITASDAQARGAAAIAVGNAAAASLAIAGAPDSADAGDAVALRITALDAFGNVAKDYTGTVTLTSTDETATIPATIGFTAADQGVKIVSLTFGASGTATVTAAAGAAMTATTPAIHVHPAPARRVSISGVPDSAQAGQSVSATLTVLDAFGNTAAYSGNIHLVLTDAAGTVSDVTADAGVATASFAFATTGKQSLVVAQPGLSGSAEFDVTPAQATHYQVADLPAAAIAGQSLTLVAVALDGFGNVDSAYGAVAHVAGSTGDQLPADTAFTAGRLELGLAFTTTGAHSVSLSEATGTISMTSTLVSVSSDVASAIVITPADGAATAGDAASFTARAVDRFGNVVPTYTGTIDFSSSDGAFVSPGPVTFSGADAGSRTLSVTFNTAGAARLDAHDTASGSIAGGAQWSVAANTAASCVVDQAPSITTATTTIGFRVTVYDAHGNKATGYAGTMALGSSDAAAQFPAASVTYSPSVDKGSHAFTATLNTAGAQTLTATDSTNALTCSATVYVNAAATPFKVVLSHDANAGAPASATITAVDAYGATVTGYAGTVTFSSSDAAAVLPANVVFDGTQNGTATVAVTFNTLGTQTLVAKSTADASVNGAGSTLVHGFVYTNPPSNLGTVQLVANNTSTPGVVQLDLVVRNTVRNGFGAGMNLPADSTRVAADTTPIVAGTALGTTGVTFSTKAALANNTLFSVHSRQNTSAGAGGDVQLTAGTVVYSVRLKLTPTGQPGTVFDGSGVMPGFRAAVRDRLGNDTVAQNDFAIGKLEVR